MTVFVLGAVFSVVMHEFAHAAVAFRCGDATAQRAGRMTLNPLVHLDPVLSFALPLATFMLFGLVIGCAKPVPVSYARLTKSQQFLVASAGIASNLLLGLLLWPLSAPLAIFNFALAAFNLLPIPPLDGWRMLEAAR